LQDQPQDKRLRHRITHLKCCFAALLTLVTPVSGLAMRSILLI